MVGLLPEVLVQQLLRDGRPEQTLSPEQGGGKTGCEVLPEGRVMQPLTEGHGQTVLPPVKHRGGKSGGEGSAQDPFAEDEVLGQGP